jgi:glycosyltransferase involved in cell wall biosynthesis
LTDAPYLEDSSNSRGAYVDYLIGGLRISLAPNSSTPGPRNHITNFVGGLRNNQCAVELTLSSDMPLLTRFASIREGAAGRRSRVAVLASDCVRIAAAAWSGIQVWQHSTSRVDIVYERAAVMQSLTSWHRGKRRAIRVVESNGLMSIETAADRGALLLTSVAKAIERHVYRRADIVVAVSGRLRDDLVAFANIDPAKTIVIPNAMPRKAVGVPLKSTDVPVIGFAGSVVPWQQLDALLTALSELKSLPWRVEIIGDGPTIPELQKLVVSLCIQDRISWLGRLDQDETYSHMAGWDIGYSGHKATSATEMYHSPLKLYEYASFGLRCICTKSSDADELAQSGLIVDYFDDGESLRAALTNAMSSGRSALEARDALRQRLAEGHDWDARARLFLDAVWSRTADRSLASQ